MSKILIVLAALLVTSAAWACSGADQASRARATAFALDGLNFPNVQPGLATVEIESESENSTEFRVEVSGDYLGANVYRVIVDIRSCLVEKIEFMMALE